MTAAPAAALTPPALLAALLEDAGGAVDGASAGSIDGAPPIAGLPEARAEALLAAWTGARLHAGEIGLLAADDPDVALLVGDWCYAHALAAVASIGDLHAIALLSHAIDQGATGRAGQPAAGPELTEIWARTGREMSRSG